MKRFLQGLGVAVLALTVETYRRRTRQLAVFHDTQPLPHWKLDDPAEDPTPSQAFSPGLGQ